jgi:phosphate-selective porin
MIAKTKTRKRARQTLMPVAALLLLGAAVPAFGGPTMNVGDEGSLTVSYALQVWMQNRGYTSSTDNGDSTDFFLRRNRLTFAGQYNDLVGFYAQLDASSDSKGGVDDKPVFFRDAYVTLDFSDPIRFIVGRFKNTFTRENLEACLEPLTLDRAEVIAYTPFAGSRDTGVAMWGNLFNGHFQYRLMAADGREGDVVVEDAPRLTARVHLSLLDPEYEYGYRGTYLGTKRVLTLGAAYDQQAKVAYSDFVTKTGASDYQGWTADLFYEQPTSSGTYTFSAAYIDYSTDEAINGPLPDPLLPVTSEIDAAYVKLGYLFPNKIGMGRLQLFARQELAEYNLFGGFRDQTWTGAGANYYLDGQRLKLTFEYADVGFDKPHPIDPSLQDYKQATLGLQLIF